MVSVRWTRRRRTAGGPRPTRPFARDRGEHSQGPSGRYRGQSAGAPTFRTLNRQNLFALTFRTNNMKTPAGRARKIAALVAMLARGETIAPQAPRSRL